MAEKDIIACGDLFLDTDTDPRLNKGSDYILNTIITSDGRHNIAINCKGNQIILYPIQNPLFVAVGYLEPNANYNNIIESGSGKSWVAKTKTQNYYLTNVIFGNYLFIASTTFHNITVKKVLISSDGNNWTEIDMEQEVLAMCYGNGLYVAIGATSTSPLAMISTDGITWTSSPVPNNLWKSVTYGNGLFVAVGYTTPLSGSTNQIMTSPDGINWTLRTAPAIKEWVSIVFSPTTVDPISPHHTGLFVAVAYSDNSRYGADVLMTSSDGILWHATTCPQKFYRSVTYGNGLFVAVGDSVTGDNVSTSSDGLIWTSHDGISEYFGVWNSVTYGNGLFVAVGITGNSIPGVPAIMTSPDGINWTKRTSPVNFEWQAITYGTEESEEITLLGWCEDHQRSRIILFMTSSSRNTIAYYDINTQEYGIIMNIMLGVGGKLQLNFNTSYKIYNPKVVGDFLYWTDGYNPPRKINYIRAYNLTNAISTDYKYKTFLDLSDHISSNVIDAYKPPAIDYGYDPITGVLNNLKGIIVSYSWGSITTGTKLSRKSYQWSYKSVYADSEKSVLSPYTSIYYTDQYYFPNGELRQDVGITHYNLLMPYNAEQDVISTELYVRDNEASDWYLYDTINYSKGFYVSGDFINLMLITVSSPLTQATISQVGDTSSCFVGLYFEDGLGNKAYITKILSSTTFEFSSAMPAGFYFVNIIGINYVFDDTKLRIQSDQKDLNRPYDYLPILAGKQELIEKNRLIYGDITEGYDPVTVDVDTTVEYVNTTLQEDNQVYYYIQSDSTYYYLTFSNYSGYSLYGIQLITGTTSVPIFIDVRYVAQSVYYPGYENDILQSLATKLISKGIANVILSGYGTSSYTWIRIPKVSITYPNADNFITMFSYPLKSVYKTMKNYDTYLGGITYYDKNLRKSSVNKFSSGVYVDRGITLSGNAQYSYVNVTIKSLPPIWSYYYTIDFTERTKYGDYWHIYAMYIFDFVFGNQYKTNNIADYNTGDGYLRIRVNNIINYSHDYNGATNISSYTFEQGDRVRVIARSNDYGSNWGRRGIIKLATYLTVLDVEILRMEWPTDDTQYLKDKATTPAYITDANGNKVQSDLTSFIVVPINFDQLGMPTGYSRDFLFEIYRPKKVSENPYYFPSKLYTVGFNYDVYGNIINSYHRGDTQHQDSSQPITVPAICNVYPGDTYLKLRDCKSIYVCTDDNYSDYYPSNFYGNGSPNIYDTNAKQSVLPTGLRHSGILLEYTKVNKLNQFNANDLEVLKSEFGSIQFIKEVGDILKVLQDKKETSILIGRQEMRHPNDSTTLITVESVIGTVKRMDELRGTQYPGSVVLHNRNLYYWDGIRGEVIRSAPNGQIPISEYGMKTYFKNKTGYIDVVAGFDETNNIYFITFIGGTSETLGFYDPAIEGIKPRWISFFSFIPQLYVSSGSFFASFNSMGLYQHNYNNRCIFYGVKYKQQIDLYFNSNAAIKKLFKAIGIKSNKAWSVPVISIEADSSYPRGQLSKLNTNHFVLKEGDYFAELLNNMLTTSNTASNLDLVEGDKLRGYAVKLQLENTENSEVWLLALEIQYEPSNLY
jgi:hypothetical protein